MKLSDDMQSQDTGREKLITWLTDKDTIREIVCDLFIRTDAMDWNGLLTEVFTPEVNLDMKSVGGLAGRVSAQSIVDGWREGFKGLSSVHHQIGNLKASVSGDEASAFCYGTAMHFKPVASGRNTRSYIGDYRLQFIRTGGAWKICGLTFNLKFMDGNVNFD